MEKIHKEHTLEIHRKSLSEVCCLCCLCSRKSMTYAEKMERKKPITCKHYEEDILWPHTLEISRIHLNSSLPSAEGTSMLLDGVGGLGRAVGPVAELVLPEVPDDLCSTLPPLGEPIWNIPIDNVWISYLHVMPGVSSCWKKKPMRLTKLDKELAKGDHVLTNNSWIALQNI